MSSSDLSSKAKTLRMVRAKHPELTLRGASDIYDSMVEAMAAGTPKTERIDGEDVEALKQQITFLEDEVYLAHGREDRTHNEMIAEIKALQDQRAKIQERLWRLADEQGWCEEFDIEMEEHGLERRPQVFGGWIQLSDPYNQNNGTIQFWYETSGKTREEARATITRDTMLREFHSRIPNMMLTGIWGEVE